MRGVYSADSLSKIVIKAKGINASSGSLKGRDFEENKIMILQETIEKSNVFTEI